MHDVKAKPFLFKQMLETGWVTLVVDARRVGVLTPPRFLGQHCLKLQYGLNMEDTPIEDMEYDYVGVRATLSFNEGEWLTFIPWEAVWAMLCTDGTQFVFHGDVPGDVDHTTGQLVEEVRLN